MLNVLGECGAILIMYNLSCTFFKYITPHLVVFSKYISQCEAEQHIF